MADRMVVLMADQKGLSLALLWVVLTVVRMASRSAPRMVALMVVQMAFPLADQTVALTAD